MHSKCEGLLAEVPTGDCILDDISAPLANVPSGGGSRGVVGGGLSVHVRDMCVQGWLFFWICSYPGEIYVEGGYGLEARRRR